MSPYVPVILLASAMAVAVGSMGFIVGSDRRGRAKGDDHRHALERRVARTCFFVSVAVMLVTILIFGFLD